MNPGTAIDQFIQYLTAKITLSADELAQIRQVAIQKKIRKRQLLLQEGDVWRYNAFVGHGFLRTYSIDNKGNEHILNFSPENYWSGDRESLTTGNPSRFNIEAIEDTDVVLITKENFEQLCRNIPQLNDLVNAILHKSFVVSQDRIHAGISLSAEEKYQKFLNQYPQIANRVPQHMIASYIGITPETLTRIRRSSAGK
ncbi:CRP-like cAMP-binding protein [Dyadobacter sp. BE34]|uniref:CRP-like cAMP-binding protein n=1 Tax=Dyadobacter fermentans TaxID=94254 RepID=A0ABU1QZX3_9BACT|nr:MULTISPECIES: Crp/Fnr family transcriptional regulator [Dyadobacter]MDR6806707.1 CRP-like cAMP-binding protein [Dyadobacter fermentans]MDR7044449.1 CRP-like cAMP-binding protein [Dyadobacter sp. BE242]MDR7198759.1 CRP-like cAMP-binding protein [Dyadobacter sp. BE34]MDR7216721.1 CRP-like cAMP-binding protein [Dyadobacter sp. BE31]MDR7263753.1 CRP-like cAMP-binding protein [Dyadobacter sp. BE32]